MLLNGEFKIISIASNYIHKVLKMRAQIMKLKNIQRFMVKVKNILDRQN